MRHYVLLLLGSFTLWLATACGHPAPPPLPPPPPEYFYQPHRCAPVWAPVEDSASAPAREQIRMSQVATPTRQLRAPQPRFYTRWRRVHGRWYHFTYRAGQHTLGLLGAELPRVRQIT